MPFQKPPTKAELRKQLCTAVSSYLNNGGEVRKIPRGQSGRTDNNPMGQVLFDGPKTNRTYVTDVVANIEARRKPLAEKVAKKKALKPRLKTLYDDFGEPLRKVWVDD